MILLIILNVIELIRKDIINMDNNTAKEIIIEYLFADYNMDVLNKYLNISEQDQLHREALLNEALRKAVISLGKKESKPY